MDLLLDLDLEINSERKSIKCIEPLMNDIREIVNISDQMFYNMLIAVTEAVNNAIVHGNKCEIAKQVKIHIEVNHQNIVVVIEDQGKGFDPESIADPRAPENLFKENGRGIFLMRQLANEVDFFFTGSGTRIIMRFIL